MVKRNQKYEPKVHARFELVQNNSLIFDLSKLNVYPDTLIDSVKFDGINKEGD